ncbi:uncharacterized protein Z518_04437 [Rhinocladiella mackenziei CBS 650.93]|uniref:GST N-terminal domain-containing protein n=1 Tax=Rhinocladiella mackenziei CBS 650.93 TaxID=1442369 RepID=A0A0D2ITH4_9EURO|nr:uncharacterized protein Z518_04437 [Rhinocladiella mackenziei CBS 650.93]KIX06461.1 hypothetical protein Z518_04437 [Rhinocladiella mackenziei CBS 650.93]
MSEEIILYDLASKQGKCWSLNTWKTRLYLNFKGIPYKTEWIEYPDLKPTFEKLGIPPNESGFQYTSPTVRLPDGTCIMESRKIADALESKYPNPPLHLDSPYQSRIEAFMPQLFTPIRPVFVPLVPKVFLNPRSQEYYIASREKSMGMTLDQYAQGRDKGFEDAKPFVKQLGEMLKENPGGPFLMGGEPCYADLVVLGWVKMMDGLGWKEKFFACEGGEEIKRLYEAGGKWLERDSY